MTKKKQINCYGFDISLNYRHKNSIEPYQFVKVGNDIYVRFFDENPCPVIKITKDGDTYTQKWAYGDWDSRESLDYDLTINEARDVEVEV